jgi:hypothetical protein
VNGDARGVRRARERGTRAARSGRPIMSVWHGWGGVHGGARVSLARGIGRRGRHGAGGEVTDQGMVGAALP